MSGVENSFGNMTMGSPLGVPVQQPSMPPPSDDFGDFSTATPSLAMPTVYTNTPDPMSKLINLGGLSKNPSRLNANANRQQMNNEMGNPMTNAMINPRTGQMFMPATAVQQPGTYANEGLGT
jgi:hypothetical protein